MRIQPPQALEGRTGRSGTLAIHFVVACFLVRLWETPGTATIPQYRINKTKQNRNFGWRFQIVGASPLARSWWNPGTATIYRIGLINQNNTHTKVLQSNSERGMSVLGTVALRESLSESPWLLAACSYFSCNSRYPMNDLKICQGQPRHCALW